MSEKTKSVPALSCEQFHAQLPDLIGSGQDLSHHPHLDTCPSCRSLVRDLEYIAAQARLLLPAEDDPSPSVWSGIASRLKDEKDYDTTK
jgi:hypothetical protein